MTASSFVEIDPDVREASGIGTEFARYFCCSAIALSADFGLFSLGLALGATYPIGAAIGFIAGLWIAYALSVRFVFRIRTLANERFEFLVFAGIGVLGLLLTEALLWLFISRIGLSPWLAKALTSGMVFTFNFGARRALLFTRQAKGAFA